MVNEVSLPINHYCSLNGGSHLNHADTTTDKAGYARVETRSQRGANLSESPSRSREKFFAWPSQFPMVPGSAPALGCRRVRLAPDMSKIPPAYGRIFFESPREGAGLCARGRTRSPGPWRCRAFGKVGSPGFAGDFHCR